MKNPIAAALACVTVVLGGCSASGPADPAELLLAPADVDVAYSVEDLDEVPFLMRGCLVDNLGQRIDGVETAGRTFDRPVAGERFSHYVATTGDREPEAVLDEIEKLVGTCEVEARATVSSDSVMTTSFSYRLEEGPRLGERTVWVSSTLDVAHTSGYDSTGDASASAIFVKDGALHRLVAPVALDWDAGVDFILEQAENL